MGDEGLLSCATGRTGLTPSERRSKKLGPLSSNLTTRLVWTSFLCPRQKGLRRRVAARLRIGQVIQSKSRIELFAEQIVTGQKFKKKKKTLGPVKITVVKGSLLDEKVHFQLSSRKQATALYPSLTQYVHVSARVSTKICLYQEKFTIFRVP